MGIWVAPMHTGTASWHPGGSRTKRDRDDLLVVRRHPQAMKHQISKDAPWMYSMTCPQPSIFADIMIWVCKADDKTAHVAKCAMMDRRRGSERIWQWDSRDSVEE